MMPLHTFTYIKAYAAFVLVKAAIMSVVAFAVDVTFIKSLALVSASAVVTGAFGIVIALMQRDSDRRLHGRIDVIEKRQIENTHQTASIASATGAQTITEAKTGTPETGAAQSGAEAGGEGTAAPGA